MDQLLLNLAVFQSPPEDATLFIGLFNPWLVGAAAGVAMVGIYAVFAAKHFATVNSNIIRSPQILRWTLGAALGVSLWIMQFIGLIGYTLPVPVAYDPLRTAVSVLPVVFGAVIALRLLEPQKRHGQWLRIAGAGLCLGAGMLATHVAGISAIDFAGMVRADSAEVEVWGLGSWALACLALAAPVWLQQRLPNHRAVALWLSSVLSGAMLYGVHRYGMEITAFMTDPTADLVVEGYDPEWLAAIIMGIAALMGTLAWLLFMRSFLRQIERSNRLLNQTLELTQSGYWEYDANQLCMVLSPQAAKLFGLVTQKAELRISWSDWLACVHRMGEAHAINCQEQLKALVSGKTGHINWTFPYWPHDQETPNWVNCVGTAVQDTAQQQMRYYFAVQDVTQEYVLKNELKASKEAADAANKTKGEFLANMSHEIRTPMNAILGLTELALRQPMTPKLGDYLGKVQLAAKNLLGIINDILDLSKVESGKMELEITDFNLDDVLDNLSTVLATSIEEKGLELLFDRRPDVVIDLKGDPLRLGQVLLNLCGNARKFTEHGSIVVRVSATQRQGSLSRLLFEIVDSGIGMTPEQVNRLFQPFSQADASTTRKYGGTGLGLAISKQLVELMGGTIGVKSTPGQGSTFYFEVPFEHGDADRGMALLTNQLEGLRVMVVDDNPMAREILKAHLQHFRCDVRICESADEAIPQVLSADARQPIELILMDYRMPGTDGLTAAHRIRHELGLMHPPQIILVTAASHFDGHDEHTIAQAVSEVLNKPVNASMLFDAVMNALGHTGAITHKPAQRKLVETAGLDQIKGAHVMLVEDNPINQEVAHEFLTSMGLKVTIAQHGAHALELLAQQTPELVLMDVQMPIMDGYTATAEIRKNPAWKDLPVIAMTANVMAEDRKMASQAGMNDHVAKPIVMAQLQAALVRWLKPRDQMAPDDSGPLALDDVDHVWPAETEAFKPAKALDTMGGNSRLLKKMLLEFIDGHAQDGPEIRRLTELTQWSDAQRMAHTMKGLAGMLGAPQLQSSSQVLEKELERKEGGNWAEAMRLWQSDLDVVMTHLVSWRDELAPPPPPLQPSEPKDIRALVERLERLLQGFDPESIEVAEQLAECDSEHSEIWAEVKERAYGFDFEAALKALHQTRTPS
jgi:signal transduction histidine kinase/DNA-binding response OmpR family regulator/NO-binding membrane sensor protein with MHYT domain